MTVKRVYIIIVSLCVAGWIWLGISFLLQQQEVGMVACLSKSVTDLPCPSCGTTRSVLSFFKGDLVSAVVEWNPLGVFASLALLVFPFWLTHDFVFRKKSLYNAYIRFENTLKKPRVYIPIFALLVLNWIWNIYKGL